MKWRQLNHATDKLQVDVLQKWLSLTLAEDFVSHSRDSSCSLSTTKQSRARWVGLVARVSDLYSLVPGWYPSSNVNYRDKTAAGHCFRLVNRLKSVFTLFMNAKKSRLIRIPSFLICSLGCWTAIKRTSCCMIANSPISELRIKNAVFFDRLNGNLQMTCATPDRRSPRFRCIFGTLNATL